MAETAAPSTGKTVVLPLADPGTGDPENRAATPPLRRSVLRAVIARGLPLVAAMLLGGVIGLYFQPPGLQAFFQLTGLQPGGGTDTPIAEAIDTVREQEELSVVAEGDVVALGRVIPRDDVITLGLPFGAGDTRIEEMRVMVGDVVSAGDVVAVLDNRATLEGAIASARASVAVQSAALAQTRTAIAASHDEAQAELERAQATLVEATSTLERTEGLFERGVASDSVLQTAQTRAEEAARDAQRARATLTRFAGDPEEQVDIVLARANLEAAEAELLRAEEDVARADIRAPIDGTVIDINVRVGERPDGAGILDLGNTDVMMVEAEVYQTLIGRVAIGDPVSILADAFQSPLSGIVTAIGLEIGRQSITSDDPAANTDARVVDVLITLDPDSTAAARRFTNLEVVARIDAGRAE